MYYNSKEENSQEVLQDFSKTGKERPWKEQKSQAEIIAQLFLQFDEKKAEKVRDCADWLKFGKVEGGLRLKMANFCRVRLCPMCQWRRSLKVYGQMARICDNIDWEKYAAVTLNLSLENCMPEHLSERLDELLEAFRRLMQYKEVSAAVHGVYRATEITVNNEEGSAWKGTLHPHLHCLLLVRRSYFKSRLYIKQARWVELWQRAAAVDYTPQAFVRKVYVEKGQTLGQALAEVCKYTLKSSDLYGDLRNADTLLRQIDEALQGRRFLGLSGMFRDLHKRLNLTDINDDGDLIRGDDEICDEIVTDDLLYFWRSGAYVKF